MLKKFLAPIAACVALFAHGQTAIAQQDAAPPPRPGMVTMEKFNALRAQCEAGACSKRGGDACVEAASIMLGDAAPGDLHDMNANQKTRYALRLLEQAVGFSNPARAMAYDLYSASTFFSAGYADPFRANEIMGMMVAASYPGGPLRKARAVVGIFAAGSPDDERGRGCALAKELLARGQLDADSKRIAQEITETSSCVSLEPVKR